MRMARSRSASNIERRKPRTKATTFGRATPYGAKLGTQLLNPGGTFKAGHNGRLRRLRRMTMHAFRSIFPTLIFTTASSG